MRSYLRALSQKVFGSRVKGAYLYPDGIRWNH